MSRIEALLSLSGYARGVEAAFVTGLDESQRNAVGSAEAWTAKDVVAHVASWRRRGVELLEGARQGSVPEEMAEFDEINRKFYLEHRDRSWEEVLEQSDSVWTSFMESLPGVPPAALDDEALSNPPLWRRLTIDAGNHPVLHFAEHAARTGRTDEAVRWMEGLSPCLLALDDSDDWQGNVHYNLGCYYALAGRRELALKALRTGFSLRRSLKDWAPKDSDLTSLHQDPEFLQLLRD
jgi:hypothetical protein